MRFITDNVAGYWAARWFLKEHQVALVIGLGGYASAATVRAATSREIPAVILEQNAVPSHVTRWLAKSVDLVCSGFDEIRAYLPAETPLVVTGNPARAAFEQLYRKRPIGLRVHGPENEMQNSNPSSQHAPRRLVVIGGAGGARSINERMPLAVSQMGELFHNWQIVHQSGEGQLQQTAERYNRAGVDALVVSYIDEMAPVMFDSDLVVCRAAGTTLAELALAGVPAVLVPFSRDVEAFQLANAEFVAAAGAATVIDETSLDSTLDQALVEHLSPLAADTFRRQAMARNMRSLARPDAAAHITDAICSVLGADTARLAA
jgi:UDP-N-acetylglucosamine--N-acetylmuramyl-(pentapeptide) pyrophosphoryl-undecaprenol N-acetylglucosamine transferase